MADTTSPDQFQPDPALIKQLRFRVGTDIIPEFVLGHDPLAVIRELAQNEYDAGGSEMTVHIGRGKLTVTGNGKGIDDDGWRRLSVMLSTGRTMDSDSPIAPKRSSIGSKNFGLRSLFFFGDQIVVRSNGKYTLLHWAEGTLAEPAFDDGWGDRKGTQVSLQLRTKPSGELPVFKVTDEPKHLSLIATQLPLMLLKLGGGEGHRSMKKITVESNGLRPKLRSR